MATFRKFYSENFYIVKGWMVNTLRLKGLEKELFAILFGFSQDGESYFDGSMEYLVDATLATKRGIIKALNSLEIKGLITKESGRNETGNTRNKYYVNVLLRDGKVVFVRGEKSGSEFSTYELSSLPPYELSSPTPIIYNNNNINNNVVSAKTSTTTNDEKPETEDKNLPLNTKAAEPQEKEKNCVKREKESNFISLYNYERKRLKPTSRGLLLDLKAKRQLHAALKDGFSIEDLITVFKNAAKTDYHKDTGFRYLTPEFITRMDKINLYIEEQRNNFASNKNGDFEYKPFD